MPKNIRMSVGQGGRNALPQDVMTIQYLLNCVPTSYGGPMPELAVDGIAGPRTVAAIKGFQRRFMTMPDGRVDPGGQTLARLQQFDPYPNQPMPAWAAVLKGPGGYKEGLDQTGKKQGFGPAGDKQGFGPPGYKWAAGDKQGFGPPGYKGAAGHKQGFGPPGYKGGGLDPAGHKQGFDPSGKKQGYGPPGYKRGMKGPGGFKSGW